MQTAAQVRNDVSPKNDAPAHDIVESAIAAGTFTILVNAIKAADLVNTLKGAGPFTVFAPSDAAFRKLPAGTVDSLLKDKPRLAKILSYHVVAGKIMAKDLKSGDVKTLQGEIVKVVENANGVTINNAKITKTDIETSNGVIHSIDTVLMPS
jgi:uncharacterized surface protein with fasciclin (FAS1) repeats